MEYNRILYSRYYVDFGVSNNPQICRSSFSMHDNQYYFNSSLICETELYLFIGLNFFLNFLDLLPIAILIFSAFYSNETF